MLPPGVVWPGGLAGDVSPTAPNCVTHEIRLPGRAASGDIGQERTASRSQEGIKGGASTRPWAPQAGGARLEGRSARREGTPHGLLGAVLGHIRKMLGHMVSR